MDLNKTEFVENIFSNIPWYGYALAYSPFIVIFLAIIGNIPCFILLRTNKELKKMSCMMIFSFISIFDLLSLFTWNLDIYFSILYKFEYEPKSLVTCRLMMFLQYFGKQSSALLLSLISIDRYITIISKPGSCISKLPFGTPKYAFIWSSVITCLIFTLNAHILILNGYLDEIKYSNQT